MHQEEGIPRIQLKKFSDELKASDQRAQRNYHQLNVERVGRFIKKNPLDFNFKNSRGEYNSTYRAIAHRSSSALVVDTPAECIKDIGPKSKFGDGDGSLWDRWLNCNEPLNESKKIIDDNGFPRAQSGPLCGFKMFYTGNLQVRTSSDSKPYMQRKMERSLAQEGWVA